MDPLRRDLVTLAWGPGLLVSSLEGGAEGVFGRPASELVGRPLAEVLGVSHDAARALHLRAAPAGVVEHLTSKRGGYPVCLRATTFLMEGDLRSASVLNLTALLDGVPPFHLSWLAYFHHSSRNSLSSMQMAIQTVVRNPDLSDRDKRRLTVANRELRTLDRMLWLLAEYVRDPEYTPDWLPRATKLISVRSLFQQAASRVEPELAERQVELAFREEDYDLPAVTAEPYGLCLALSQLLLNVAHRLDPGTRLGITLRRSGQGAQAMIRGPSLAVRPDEQRMLYEPFGLYQGRGGDGFSLAVLRRVMLSHGGQFVAEEDGSQGTLYTLTFVV